MASRGVWVYDPKPAAPKPAAKSNVDKAIGDLIETYLKPTYVVTAPEDPQWPYVVDIRTKWRGAYLYLIAVYRDPRPDAAEATYEAQFSRIGSFPSDRYNVSYMRHTGKFCEICPGIPLSGAIELIKDIPVFSP